MEDAFLENLYEEHKSIRYLPSPDEVCQLFRRSLQLLFPEFSEENFHSLQGFKLQWNRLKQDFIGLFQKLNMEELPVHTTNLLFAQLPELKKRLEKDARAILEGDPASVDIHEVKRTYPGFLAIAHYRFAHLLHQLKVP